LKLIGAALAQNKDLTIYHYVEKLAPNVRVMLVPNNAPFILPLPNLETLDPITATVANTVANTVAKPAAALEAPTQGMTQTQILSTTPTLSVTLPVTLTVPVSATVNP
jgi:hypothetical protein